MRTTFNITRSSQSRMWSLLHIVLSFVIGVCCTCMLQELIAGDHP